ncbi:MAG TPA: hypothetical protein VNN20_03145 [Thermodesulfobacteriota bacterium]|nr:hypothetical protein [Thermodesulfobacteriota bacterium]
MTVTVSLFTIGSEAELKLYLFKNDQEKSKKPVVYWGIYLNNEQISYTSSRQLAEETKSWMENWLKDKS